MTWIGMGKVTVSTAGTPVALSANRLKVHSVIITYDPVDTGAVYVKDSSGNLMAALGASASPVILESLGADEMDLSKLQVDVQTSGKGPIVCYSIA